MRDIVFYRGRDINASSTRRWLFGGAHTSTRVGNLSCCRYYIFILRCLDGIRASYPARMILNYRLHPQYVHRILYPNFPLGLVPRIRTKLSPKLWGFSRSPISSDQSNPILAESAYSSYSIVSDSSPEVQLRLLPDEDVEVRA
jgi:hypothetical protein